MSLTWIFNVNWKGDAVPFVGSGTYIDEAANRRLLQLESLTRGRANFLKASGNGFESMGVGQCTLILDNHDGRFDAWNTTSPLYPLVTPGKFCQLKVTDSTTATTYIVFTGILQDIQPINEQIVPQVRVTIRDGAEWLRNQYLTSANILTSENVYDAIGKLLVDYTQGGYPWPNSLSSTSDTQAPNWWPDPAVNALDQIEELANNAATGWFFIAANGTATYKTNQDIYQLGSSALTLTQSNRDVQKDLTVGQPWDNVKNVVTIITHPYVADNSVVVWKLDQPIQVLAGASVTCRFFSTQPHTSAASLVAAAFQNSDGTGTNLTANFSFSNEDYTFPHIWFTVTNGSATNGYLTQYTFTSNSVKTNFSTTVQTDLSAGSRYGRRNFTLDSPWIQNNANAVVKRDFLSGYLINPKSWPIITIKGKPTQQFSVDLFSWVTLQLPAKGISSNYRIMRIEHRGVMAGGQIIETKFYLQPAGNLWTLDSSQLDNTNPTNILGN